ncbi:DUF2235 domain-containing protein [Mycena chlorophos]|uniref:DUF2235 domain-containing protein n=1 Tax=Mycena chlorophos TaxID=658473 RepID=A0A8H6VXK8_MYCCL|nr:DUF2235 domain-containing protein [Mycena chlorophos]
MEPTHNRSATEATLLGGNGSTLSTNGAGNGVSGLPTTSSPTSGSSQLPDGPARQGVIPPSHPFRTLVLCFDGTGDQFDADNSNIVQFFSMLLKDDRSKQMVYYQAGIGTYTIPQIVNPFWSRVAKFIDEAIAWNLDAHVMAGYEFLMQNYTANDRICLFGFSRGAYIARSLAGMIHKVGLLPASNHQQIPFAYKMYTRADDIGWKQSNAFKKACVPVPGIPRYICTDLMLDVQAFSNDVDIEFVGVWDTVNSVGIFPRRLPFTTSNTIVRTFRHAMALDERRAKFKVNFWNRPDEKEQNLGTTGTTPPVASTSSHASGSLPKPSKQHSHQLLEQRYARDRSVPTDIEEVWFAGCHCDVGGGSVSNETTTNLARIPLRWMIRECFRANSGIMFDCAGLRAVGLDPDTLYPFVKPRPPPLEVPRGSELRVLDVRTAERASSGAKGDDVDADADTDADAGTEESEQPAAAHPYKTEEEHDLLDTLSPVYDQLSLAWFWWVLEILPLKQRYQRGDNQWVTTIWANLGRARFIPKQVQNGVKVHRSVKVRMETATADESEEGRFYRPRAKFDLARTIWVD